MANGREQAELTNHMLVALPVDEGDHEWSLLTEWEHGFLTSVREQFERKGVLSLKQIERLEEIYKKLAEGPVKRCGWARY